MVGEGAATSASSAPVLGQSGVATSSSNGPDPVETEANDPSKQGVLEALATMMAEKDAKVCSFMLFNILRSRLIDTAVLYECW